jgi:putative addiction module killer protein
MPSLIRLLRYQTADDRAPYSDWIAGLDDKTAARVFAYVDRMKGGNFGDSKPVGDGVSELKIDFGPGFRVYYVRDGKTVVILLMGGDKSSQRADIREARAFAADYRSRS